jgi:hypothetical protein
VGHKQPSKEASFGSLAVTRSSSLVSLTTPLVSKVEPLT